MPPEGFTEALGATASAAVAPPPASVDEDDEKSQKLTRGYSMLQLNNSNDATNAACRVTNTSIHSNVLIKKKVPARGLVSSNPLRIDRLLQTCTAAGTLQNLQLHTHSGWGIKIWTATATARTTTTTPTATSSRHEEKSFEVEDEEEEDLEVFIAITPMGSTGSGFCFWELYAAGAQAIVRVGANDQTLHDEDVVICHQADNLVNLPHAAGDLEVTRQTVFTASPVLVELLQDQFPTATRLPVHHVEDFHAYNFSDCLPDHGSHIQPFIARLKRKSPNGCCWDMESAALFYRAQQYGLHAVTVLIPMTSASASASANKEGRYGGVSEVSHYELLFRTLVSFSPSAVDAATAAVAFAKSLSLSLSANTNTNTNDNTNSNGTRSERRFSTNDLIGTEDSLFCNDPELGNNLFLDDSEQGAGSGGAAANGGGGGGGGVDFRDYHEHRHHHHCHDEEEDVGGEGGGGIVF